MKKLFIIDGAMRPAKNELVKHLLSLERNLAGGGYSKIGLVKKLCTKDGGAQQDYVQDAGLKNKISGHESEWISYEYGTDDKKDIYGVKKEDLERCILNHECTFLIIRNTELVFELKEKYSHFSTPVKVITVYIYSDKKEIADSYNKTDGVNPAVPYEERKNKLLRADADYENAMALRDKYDETIIYSKQNGTGSASLAVKINSLIKKYENAIEPYSVFFIHPYHKGSGRAEELYECLKSSVKRAFNHSETDCISLINAKGSYKIGDTVWKKIETSDYIICDISSDCKCKKRRCVSANIWLELGYALCIMHKRNILIGNNLIITCQRDNWNGNNLPTDICDINIVYYKDLDDFKSKLYEHLIELMPQNKKP